MTSATGKAKREAVPPADPNDPEFDFSAVSADHHFPLAPPPPLPFIRIGVPSPSPF